MSFLPRFADHLDADRASIVAHIVEGTYAGVPGYANVPREDLAQATEQTLGVLAACCRGDRLPNEGDMEFDAAVVRRRSRQGVTAADWIAHTRVFMEVLSDEAFRHGGGTATADLIRLWGASNDHAAFAHRQFELAAAEQLREDGDRRREYLVALLRGGMTRERARDGALAIGLDPDALLHAVRVRPGSEALARALADRGVWVVDDEEVLGVTREPPAVDFGPSAAGIGPGVVLEALPTSYAAASAALEAACRFGLTGLRRLEDLGVLPLLDHDGIVADALHERFIARVERSGQGGAALVETLDEFLRRGMRPGPTASALHLHPNSLRKRLARYEELTGADLGSMDDVVAVWWALRRRSTSAGSAGS